MYILSDSTLTLKIRKKKKHFKQTNTFSYNEQILLKKGQLRALEW